MTTLAAFTSLDPHGPTSCTLQIAQQFKDQIHRGTLAPLQRLPTERSLAAQFGVSVPTVNKAMAALEAEGYLVRQVGTGTSVAPDACRGSILLSFHAAVVESGPLFFRALIQRLSARITAAGFHPELVLSPSIGPEEVDRTPAIRCLARGRVVGAISLGWSDELAAAATARGQRAIAFSAGGDNRDGFRLDFSQAVTLAVAHLAARGHRRVALLARDPADGYLGLGRPFANALEAHGMEGRFLSGIATDADAAQAARGLLADPAGARALILVDEHLAPGVALLCAILGLQMPRDLAVVTHASFGVRPSLTGSMTACGFDVDEIADMLVARSLELVRAGPNGPAPLVVSVPARLMPGSST